MDPQTSKDQPIGKEADLINQRSTQLNMLLNKLIGYNYSSKFSPSSDTNDERSEDIMQFFETLLWSEKKCPELTCQLFDMMAIQQIQAIHLSHDLATFFKGYILVMGNCQEAGIIAQQFLEHKLPHLFLEAYLEAAKTSEAKDKEELLEYVGSYLKSYYRLFRAEWLNKFIVQEEYFELLEVCFKFFKCPEPLTQTTVFNNVLSLLACPQVQQFIHNNKSRYHFYEQMANQMTILLRSELADLGTKIEQISENSKNANAFHEIVKQIDDKATLWDDISRTCRLELGQLFQLPFAKNILIPLLISPLKGDLPSLFTIKYSLLVLRKFMRVIHNFNLLEPLVRIIFVEQNVFFWPNALKHQKIKALNIAQLLDKQINHNEEQKKEDFGSNIKKFYQGVLRSKDNHFILMVTSFLNSLLETMKKNEGLKQNYGLAKNGKLLTLINQRLITQLSETHRLITIQSILNTLLILNDGEYLTHDSQASFIYTFKKIIDETKNSLKNKTDLWDFIVEINQYELLKVNAIKFGVLEDEKKFEEIYKVVFLWDIKQEEKDFFSFYSCIPDTISDHFRYLYTKFLTLRKIAPYLLTGFEQKNLLAEYYSRFPAIPPQNPGNIVPLSQLKCQFHQCQIVDGKFVIPALWLIDDGFFILGHWDKGKKEVKIIMAIKYKHISTELETKKEKILLSLSVKCYDYKSQRLKIKNSITIKGIETLMPRIVANLIRIREKEMIFITNCIKRTQELLPKPSLI